MHHHITYWLSLYYLYMLYEYFIIIVNTDCYPKIVGLSHFIYPIKIYYSKIYTKHFTWGMKCVQYVWHVAWYLCGSNYLISKKPFKCVFKTRISNEREWERSGLLYTHPCKFYCVRLWLRYGFDKSILSLHICLIQRLMPGKIWIYIMPQISKWVDLE